jgi:hypothetical protein
MWRRRFPAGCLLAALGVSGAEAQIDLTTVLVGRWEGKTEIGAP